MSRRLPSNPARSLRSDRRSARALIAATAGAALVVTVSAGPGAAATGAAPALAGPSGASLSGASLSGARPPGAGPSGVSASTTATPVDLLEGLPVLLENAQGYERAAFPGITTPRGRCTLKSAAILKAALSGRKDKRRCIVRKGSWRPEYATGKVRKPVLLGVDLVVPANETWQSGAFAWTPEQRAAYATDLRDRRTYMVTTRKTISQRKNREPQQWLPKVRCGYAVDWILVKHRWQLAVDHAERDALAQTLGSCGAAATTPVTVGPVATVPPADVPPSTSLVGRRIGAEMFGLNVDPSAIAPTAPYGVMRLWDEFTWAVTEPQQDVFNWTRIDRAVAEAQRVGARVLLVLAGTPGWAAASPGADAVVTASSPPRDMADYEDYVRRVVQRYSGRIWGYQVWNEANLSTYWRGTAEQMADLTARVHTIVKGIDPAAQVMAASTTIRLVAAFGAFYPDYLAGLRARGWPIDLFSVHSYPPSTGGSAERDAGLALLRVVMRQQQAPDLPVWETEINFGLAGPGPTFPDQDFTPAEQQRIVVRAYLDSLRNALASTVWYRWQAEDLDLLGVQMTPNSAAAQAYAAMVATLVGSVFDGCTDEGAVSSCSFSGGPAGAFRVMWATSGTPSVPIAPATSACTLATGACRPGPQVALTGDPVVVR